ncbi:hypothetical protein M409DRAFT_51921 [Zasmidium cellare ATCC 36951]|uniref:SnoaL-like domain-containing protein n=1 Tax=Zasmidium cellare ATCC 36951 TaxID=1080233 RepID=A0A6A6CSV0_ZASCE|nr:uncharacterized protein M409DRAFT_51921 [Zasmidium cellare ATCC 36951]KAF2170171.1 hypothetical protein M409DRAFT_51921 [Zasmidium cellare ATCC 36951]
MTATKDLDDIEAIKGLIQAFFDRVNANDPPGLQALFVPNAHLTILRQDPPRPPPPSSSGAYLPQPPTPTPIKEQEEQDNKISLIYQSTIEAFIKLIQDGNRRKKPGDKPVPTVHEVPNLAATDVRVDGDFAQAWCPFTVTFDGVLHHYGFFAYTFGKTRERSVGKDGGEGEGKRKEWRFEGLTQDYRRTPGWEGDGESELMYV